MVEQTQTAVLMQVQDNGYVYPLELSPEEMKLILRLRQLDSPCLLMVDVNGRGQPESVRVLRTKRESLV